MRKKVINKTIEEVVYADGHTDFKVKYTIRGLFGRTYEEYDQIIFSDWQMAELFTTLNNSPSSILSIDDFAGGHSFNGWNWSRYELKYIVQLNTIYDNEIGLMSASDWKEYEEKKKNNKYPYHLYMIFNEDGYDEKNHKYLVGKYNCGLKFVLAADRRDPKYTRDDNYRLSYYRENLYCQKNNNEKYSDFLIKDIKRRIGEREDQITKSLKEHQEKIKAEQMYTTVVSVNKTEIGITEDIEKKSNELDIAIANLENQQLYKERNDLINAELKRIDQYRQHLVSLLK